MGDARRWTPRGTLPGESWYSAIAFSPDGSRLAFSGGEGTTQLWELPAQRLIATLHSERTGGGLASQRSGLSAVAFSPDGRWLATSGLDSLVRLWDARTGQVVKMLRGHAGYVSALGFSQDGSRLASGGTDRMIKVWNPATGEELITLPGHVGAQVTDVQFLRDGATLMSVSSSGPVRFWRAATADEVRADRTGVGSSSPVAVR